jgi:hypothetical protein
MPNWTKFWLDVQNEGYEDDGSKIEMQLDQEKSPKKIQKVIYQRAGVTEGVIGVKLSCHMEIGKEFERDAEGNIMHHRNEAPQTKKEEFVRNKRTKSGNIVREVKEY